MVEAVLLLGVGLGAEHFLTGVDEGNALGGDVVSGSQTVHVGGLVLDIGCGLAGGVHGIDGQVVEQGVVVVAGSVVDSLQRSVDGAAVGTPGGVAHVALDDGLLGTSVHVAGNKALVGGGEDAAVDDVTDGVVEECEGASLGVDLVVVGLDGHLIDVTVLGGPGTHLPALAVEDDVGVDRMDSSHDSIDGLVVDQADQVPAEAVDVVLLSPVQDGVDDVLANHGTLGSGVVAAAGVGLVRAIVMDTAEVAGNNAVEAEVASVCNVVVDNVHDDADLGIMQSLNHLLELIDADFAVVGIGGVGTLGNVVVLGIVAPVVAADGLINGVDVVNGQQVDIVDAQFLHVVNAGGDVSAGNGGATLGEGQVLTLVVHAGGLVDGEVTDMQLPDDGIGVVFLGDVGVVLPTLGVGGIQVDDHGTVTVDAGGTGIGIAGLCDFAHDIDGVGVVDAVQIALDVGEPGAVGVSGHGVGVDLVAADACIVQSQDNLGSGGSPHAEKGALCAPGCAQVVAVVGVSGFEFGSGVGVGDGHVAACAVVVDHILVLLGDSALSVLDDVVALGAGLQGHIGDLDLAVGAFQGEQAVQVAFDGHGSGHGQNAGEGIPNSGGDLCAQGAVRNVGVEVLKCGTGLCIDMDSTVQNLADVDVTVAVGILGPVGLLDDEADPGIRSVSVVSSGLGIGGAVVGDFVILEGAGGAQALHAVPHVDFPAVVVAVGAVVVNLDGDVVVGRIDGNNGIGLAGLTEDHIDLLGVVVEGDGNIVGFIGGEDVVVAIVTPAVAPGTVGDLELMGTGGDTLEGLGVQTVSAQNHLIGLIAGVPAHTAQTLGACNVTGLAHIGQGDLDLLGLFGEGDGHVLVLGGGEDEVVAVVAPAVAPGAIGDLELMGAGGNVIENLLIDAGGNAAHLVGCVTGVPFLAAQSLGACHVVFGRGLGDVGLDCDLLGFCIEGDGHVLNFVQGELVVRTILAPAVVPGTVGDLELMGACRNAHIDLFIQAVSVQGHLVGLIIAGPCVAAELSSAGHEVCFIRSKSAHGDAAYQHGNRQKKTDKLFHVFSSIVDVFSIPDSSASVLKSEIIILPRLARSK